jgi:hypothetical protein
MLQREPRSSKACKDVNLNDDARASKMARAKILARSVSVAVVRAECATRALEGARRRKVDAIVAPALRIVEPDKGSPAVASGATDGKAGGQGARAVPHPRLSYGRARRIVCSLSDSVQFIFRLPGLIFRLRAATNGGWALGNARFKQRIAKALRRRVAPLPKGRPRKATQDRRQLNLL